MGHLKTAYTDGACRISNPGLCSCAWVLYVDDKEITNGRSYLGPEFHTNNFAEYMGLLNLLDYLYTNTVCNVIIYSDSELVVNQVNQVWQINNEELRRAAAKAYGLLNQGCHMLKHVSGHCSWNVGNTRADQLCNECLDAHMEEYYANSKHIVSRPMA